MLTKLWTVYWSNKLNSTDQKVDEYNGKSLGMGNGRYRKVCQFSRNEFWKNIGFIVSNPTFGLGGSRLWDMEEDINISGKDRKRHLIRIMVYL